MTDKKKIEAILFSVGKFISLEEIARLCRKEESTVKESLVELMVEYENNPNSSLIILNEGDMWKLTTREEYGGVVRSIISETELTKTQLETLAVIAFKYPIKQSDLIKIRTNKAYDHITELEKLGFITRQKYGRSKLIKLTDKFFEYFDLPKEKLKDRFKGFEQLADTIENKEKEIEDIKEKQKKIAEEAKKQDEIERKVMDGEIDLVDDQGEEHKLEGYDEKSQVEEIKETVGNLEVVDTENKIEQEKNEPSETDQETSESEPSEEVKEKEQVVEEKDDHKEEISEDENQEKVENEPIETKENSASEDQEEK